MRIRIDRLLPLIQLATTMRRVLVILQMKHFKIMKILTVTVIKSVMVKWLRVIKKAVIENGMYLVSKMNTNNGRFHLECAGLTGVPPGKWYCRDCKKIMDRERR